MTPDQTRNNETLLAVLPKHTELVPAEAGRHTVELSDYHHWLPSEPVHEATPAPEAPPDGRHRCRES